MKIKSIFGILVVVSALAVAAFGQDGATQSPVPSNDGPKLVIKEIEHNLGEVKKGSAAQYAFVFKNEGKSDLEIKGVAPACGCTASDFTRVVPPGKEGKITLSVNTSGFSGAIAKTADVYTNDPQKERFTLMMSMVITSGDAPQGRQIGPFVVGPSDQWSSRIPRGLSTNGLIAISNSSAQPIKISKAESNGDAFTYTLQTLEEGKRYALNFTSSTKLPVGSHRQTIKLTTDSKEMPALELALEAVVFPAVSISPATLTFESIPAADPEVEIPMVSKFLWVRLGRGAGLEVTSTTSDLPFIKVKVESADGQAVVLRVGFNARPPKGVHTGKIKIMTNNSDLKETEVPITINVN